MAGTGVGKFSSTAGSNTANMTVNFAENMAPSNVNNAARELMGHMRDMYEQLGDGYFEFGDGDGTYTVARGDADTITITSASDISSVYFPGRKIRITDGGANVVEGTIASSSHASTTQTVNLTGISLAAGTPTKVELGIDTAAFGGRVILDDDGDTYIEAPTDDTIDIYVAGAKDFVITANTFTAESGSTIAAQALTATTVVGSSAAQFATAGIGAAKDLGVGLHIKTADSGQGTAHASADELVIEGSGNSGINILSANNGEGGIYFGDDGDNDIGRIRYDHSNNSLDFFTNTAERMSLASNGGLTIITGDNLNTLTLTSTDADANQGPVLNFKRDSSSPADNDFLGQIVYTFNNDAPEIETALAQYVIARDVSNGSEDIEYKIEMMTAGAVVNRFGLAPTETIFNEDSADVDFRVESNGHAHAFFVNGGDDNIGLFNSAPVFTTGSGMHLADNVKIGFGNGGSGRPDFQLSADSTNLALVCGFGSDDVDININTGGKISTGGEQAPDVDSGGITLNQTNNDGAIISLKSSDVAHGITGGGGYETDTYAILKKNDANNGGLRLQSASQSAISFKHEAWATGSNTAESTSATSAWCVDARLKSGTSIGGLAADDNLASFRTSDEAKFIIKGDGELFSDQSATVGTYDAYEDAQLVRAFDLNHMQGVINSKFDKFVQYNKDDLQKAKLIGTDDDGNATPMVNITGMQRLHNGAIWQQYEKTERLANAMYELAKAAVGEEKANEILEQNEIKLLN